MKKQRRSFAAGFLTALLLTGLIGTAGAAVGRRTVEVDYNNIKVSLDGAQVALVDANGSPVEPFAINGTTYLPIRAVGSALGLEVGWDAATSTAVLTTPEEEREVYITRTGSKYHQDPRLRRRVLLAGTPVQRPGPGSGALRQVRGEHHLLQSGGVSGLHCGERQHPFFYPG